MTRPQRAAEVYWRHAWEVAAERYVTPGPPVHLREDQLRFELLFCLLGGFGVGYDLNRSAADRLWSNGVFADDTFTARQIERELTKAQFDPPRADGSPRRYRYPRRKSQILAAAQEWLLGRDALRECLMRIEGERDRRDYLCDCPGMGPKSASWLLRNAGLAENLAILDVHVLRAMESCGRIESVTLPRDYDHAETAFLAWCREIGSEPAGFDLLVWDFSRRRMAA